MKQRILAILKHSSPWSYGMLGLLIFLSFIYLNRLSNIDWTSMAEGFWNWIDPVAGIMTFITTLAIFWFQASKNWEESLEKQLSVDYFHIDNSNHLASVQNTYLAGEGDVRAWSQALGGQMMGQLDFDMNWNDPKPKIVFDSKQKHYIKHYQVLIYLTSNPLESDEGKAKAEKFLKKSFKHSEIKGDLSNLFYLDKPFWSVETMFYTKMKITQSWKYLFFFLQTLNLASMNVGTAVTSLTTAVLNNLKIVVPSSFLLSKFDGILTPMFEMKTRNIKENQELTSLRDWLLPMLMNGQVSVGDGRKLKVIRGWLLSQKGSTGKI